MLIHTIIKINYVREGYLPNHPYHLISDEEMFEAFLSDDENCFFTVNYPCMYDDFKDSYEELRSAIQYHINEYIQSDHTYVIPDWVYSYMTRSVVTIDSDTADRHDLLALLNLDNINDIITKEAMESCLSISTSWVHKLPPTRNNHRPPTMFGEPHVIKSLRLLRAGGLSS